MNPLKKVSREEEKQQQNSINFGSENYWSDSTKTLVPAPNCLPTASQNGCTCRHEFTEKICVTGFKQILQRSKLNGIVNIFTTIW